MALTSQRGSSSPTSTGRFGFDPSVERSALAALSRIDVDGCRRLYGRLLEPLRFPSGGDGRAAVLLLADALQQVVRQIFVAAPDSAEHQREREAIAIHFSGFDDPEDARRAFLPALNRLLGYLQRGPSSDHPHVARAKAFIERHYERRLSLSHIAGQLNVSPNHLSRLFRKETGETITAYIHRVRLDHARVLLARGGRSISEIGYLVGYQNYRDFYRNFVKYEKASPSGARRMMRASAGRGGTQETESR